MRARVRIELCEHGGQLLAVREAKNSVMKGGAELIAALFAGKGAPITHFGVGASDAAESDAFSTTALSETATGDAGPLQGGTDAAIPSEAFTIETDEARRLVRVRVRGTLPNGAAVGTVREAGLLSKRDDKTVLYNRVTFAPIAKGSDHELTMFWEVTFPYGDLSWG